MNKKKTNWMKYITRPTFTPLWLGSFTQAYEENVPAVISVGLTKHLFIPSEKGIEWYISRDEFTNLGRKIVEMVKQKPDFANEHRKECLKTCEELVNVCKNIGGMNLEPKSSKELCDLFLRYSEKFRDLVVFLAIPPPLDKVLSEEIKKRIKEILEKQGRLGLFNMYFDALTTLTKLTDTMKEERELLEIAISIGESNGRITPEIDKKIDAHTEKYRWLPVYAFHLDPLTKDFFVKRLNEIEGAKGLLEKRRRGFETGKEKFEKALKELRLSEDLLNLIRTLQGYVFLRTYRTDMLRKAFYHIQPLIEEIGRRAKMSRGEVAYLAQEELEDFLLKGILPDRQEVKERIKHFLLLKKPGVYEIASNKRKINAIIKKELAKEEKKVKTLKGNVAQKGKVRGVVKVIRTKKDWKKIKKGNILVTHMTTPEMMMVIKKSAAIVTDEGGVTCHAAIVSRELGIPCVIATEVATKVLKDGDLVEVDAEKGIVRILKK